MYHHQFLADFAAQINDLASRKLLSSDSLLNGEWNGNSWLHARMFGAMVRAVDPPLCPMVEVKWNRGFTPDLCIVDPADRILAVVEYESTNSSDERLLGKDLSHYEDAILEYRENVSDLPQLWLIISTLPRVPVQKWPWWGWNKDSDYPPLEKSRTTRNSNPFAYYEVGIHKGFAETSERLINEFDGICPTTLVWANIDGMSLSVLNVNGVQTDGPLFPLALDRLANGEST